MEVRPPSLVDSHCHLSSQAFREDRRAALARAREVGLELAIDVGTEPEDWGRSLALAAEHPRMRCVLGLHPNSADDWSPVIRSELRAFLSHNLVVGVGETGLDYFRMGAAKEQQREVFVEHLALARETGLPVVIHAREAYDDILDVLAEEGRGTTGVMHSYMGTWEQARRALELNYSISISGPVTYKRSDELREVAAAVPLERLLVETDSPYLPPQPHRGERNEPAHVRLTAQKIAEVRGIPYEELAAATTGNARRLFRL